MKQNRKNGKTHHRSPEFTLVELLVVLAVIAILAALLLPALNKARERAQEAACASNFKQIGQTLILYAADNAEELPPVTDSGQGQYLEDLIGIYLNRPHAPNSNKAVAMNAQKGVWFCPAYPAVPNTRNSSYGNNYLFTREQAIYWEAYSYFVKGRAYFARYTPDSHPYWHANRSDWLTSRVAIMTTGKPEENAFGSIRGTIESGSTTPALPYTYYTDAAKKETLIKNSAPHNRKSNYLYGDGHVASRSVDTKMPYNASGDYTYNWIGF